MCGWARRTSARYGSRRGRTGERLAVWIPLIPILASTDPSPPPPSAGAPSTHADSSLPALVEAHLRAHLESQGVYIDLSLPEVPPLQPLPAGNVPLPGDPASWAESLSTAVQCCSHHLDIFPPGRVALVIATFETRTTELDTDEMILVLALLAVGRQIELALLRDRACEDANVFFLLAMRTLDEWGQCSLLALGERYGLSSTSGAAHAQARCTCSTSSRSGTAPRRTLNKSSTGSRSTASSWACTTNRPYLSIRQTTAPAGSST